MIEWVSPIGSNWRSSLNGADVRQESQFSLINNSLWIERVARDPYWWGEKGSIMKWYPYCFRGPNFDEKLAELTVKLIDVTTRIHKGVPYHTAKFVVMTITKDQIDNHNSYKTNGTKRD